MIKVNLIGNNDKIEFLGHAMYDSSGKDIVCAGVSSVVITTINAILSFDENSIKYESLPDNFCIEVIEHSLITDKLLLNMVNMLKDIEEDYPKNIKIRKEN